MAKVLEDFKFTKNHGKGTYNWDELLDGKTRQLENGKDFTSKPDAFLGLARKNAKAMGKRVQSQKIESGDIVMVAHVIDVPAAIEDAEKKEAAKKPTTKKGPKDKTPSKSK